MELFFFFFKFLYWSESYANFTQKSVSPVMKIPGDDALLYEPTTDLRGIIRNVREWVNVCTTFGTRGP